MSDQECPSDKNSSLSPAPTRRSYISVDDSITTDCDPDHKSYTRHFESSEFARKILPKEYNKEGVRTLAELSSTLSASSSLSGSTQHPRNDDEDDDDVNDDHNTDMKEDDSISNSSFAPTGNRGLASLSPTHLHHPDPMATTPSAFVDLTSELNNSTTHNPNLNKSFSPPPSNNSSNSRHRNPSRFKHYHKPKVTESPRLVYLCQKFINEKNIDGLALIARRRGLPPKLRQYAWPLLLASHPYVTDPSVIAEYPTHPLPKEQIPLKRIQKEIARYQKKQSSLNPNKLRTPTTNSCSVSAITSNVHDVRHTPLYQSTKSTPISVSPTGSSWSELNNLNKASSDQQQGESVAAAYLEAQKQTVIEDAIKQFLAKWGTEIPYENAMVWMAFALAEWVDPVYRMEEKYNLMKQNSGTNTTESQASSPEIGPVGSNHSPSLSASKEPSPTNSGNATPTVESSVFSLRSLSFQLPYVFAEVFEHLMLVCFHAPKSALNGPRGPCDSPLSDSISFFLSIIRRLLPDLAKHFDEEDVIVGGDEWLLWWIKWKGSKVWDKRDRARIWDMYFGWRPTPASPGFDLQEVIAERLKAKAVGTHAAIPESFGNVPDTAIALAANDPLPKVPEMVMNLTELESEIGPDPFWSASITDDDFTATTPNLSNPSGANDHLSPIQHPTLTPEPSLEHLFVSLVLLKSKSATLLELDQSEIKACLGNLYRSKDIEGIITEAGECWRTWRHAEDVDDDE